MAPIKTALPSFDAIIQADRQRQRHSQLAQEILGKRSHQKAHRSASGRATASPSLASRVGVSKPLQRSASVNTPVQRQRKSYLDLDEPRTLPYDGPDQDLLTNRRDLVKKQDERRRADLLSEALVAKGATNQSRLSRPPQAAEISIRGAAGPYVVEASNFAAGTTAADIESAMVPSGHDMLGCSIVSTSPAVVAEMVFSEKSTALQVIDTFNNKKADGRILSLRLKLGSASSRIAASSAMSNGSGSDAPQAPSGRLSKLPDDSYDSQREQSDRARRKQEPIARNDAADTDGMDVDIDASNIPTAPRFNSRGNYRRDTYDDSRRAYRADARYDAVRDSGRESRYDRGWDGGRSGRDRPIYDDDYSRGPPRNYR